MDCKKKIVVSEYVSYGHPDKVADQISDAIVDSFLLRDSNARCGVETMVKDNVVVLGGEVNSAQNINYDYVVRNVFENVKYPQSHHLSPSDIKIINLIGKQSEEIHSGVDKADNEIGAGDQGFCVGFATNETDTYMPLGHYVAKKICTAINELGVFGFGPDAKSQVIVEYDENGDANITSILVSSMHQCPLEDLRQFIMDIIIGNRIGLSEEIYIRYFVGHDIDIVVNPCGSWNIGGSISDCGVTGRKLIVDNYGGYCNIGGGAYSGKDFTKVDRSGAYMTRYIAKNIVASGISNTAKVELSYMIGVSEPSSFNIELDKNQDKVCAIKEWINKNVSLTPYGIMQRFDASFPRCSHLAVHGHYGKTEEDMKQRTNQLFYPWEKLDLVDGLKTLL